ncbi:hypothetical protein [Streptomyces iakyrus]|uniref:hypothetical protein n=1 Tax=Streptomyces iakyrus TaxID=68219 RepID=UPI003D8EABA9
MTIFRPVAAAGVAAAIPVTETPTPAATPKDERIAFLLLISRGDMQRLPSSAE